MQVKRQAGTSCQSRRDSREGTQADRSSHTALENRSERGALWESLKGRHLLGLRLFAYMLSVCFQ